MFFTNKTKIIWTPSDEEVVELKREYSQQQLVYYTPLEEMLNAISHGVGVFLGIIAFALVANKARSASGFFLATLIGIGYVVLYGISTTYHLVTNLNLKRKVRKFDHASVILVVISSGASMMLATPPSRANYLLLGLSLSLIVVNFTGCLINFKAFKWVAFVNNFIVGSFLVVAYILNEQYVAHVAKMWYLAGVILCLLGALVYGIGKRYTHTIFHVLTFLGPLCCIIATYNML